MAAKSTIDGTPEKHIFRGMIADYDLQTGLCELLDNALDFWVASKRASKLKVEVELDVTRQIITVKDNAGGVKESDLRLLIAPGASREPSTENLIGIFGVGGKRAGVALGELVEIRSRYKREATHKIRIDDEWLLTESWDIDYVESAAIGNGCTIVEVSKLRQPFTKADVHRMGTSLGETYGRYISDTCEIFLNGAAVTGKTFEVWSYPPEFLPRTLSFTILPDGERELAVTMNAGLIGDRDPEAENYGVYIYCNNRLIVKEMRERDVGYFVTGEAGVPHPDASLCRVIVSLDGNAELMPWNSSKSDVNIAHPSFLQLRANLIALVTFYSKLSRRLKNTWDETVFPYPEGESEEIDPTEIAEGAKLILPKLPRGRRPSYLEQARQLNLAKMSSQPVTVGLVDAMIMVESLSRVKVETRNRAALILLDSNFEIALKEYIVTNKKAFPTLHYPDNRIRDILGKRTAVINEVRAKVPKFSATMSDKAEFYYGLRNKLIHERSTVPINDRQVQEYRELVEIILKLLFKLKFPPA
ncbi:ATP-binding protein [uncultured Maricaulis sp.]|uniref:ATP-binding protein n=1 Tax=uncultured Maricaulis sp. TaxID=174710 RepID=UPI0030D7B02D